MSFGKHAETVLTEISEPAGKGKSMKIVITGGEAFEAAALCGVLRSEFDARVVYLGRDGAVEKSDAFTHVSTSAKFSSFDLDPVDVGAGTDILRFEQPDAVIELAGPEADLQTTTNYLAAAGAYWAELAKARKAAFRFVHAWPRASANAHGYGAGEATVAERVAATGIPALSVRTGSSFGPYQSPLAQLPLWITNAILGRELPLANLGLDRTPRLDAEDLARGLIAVATAGAPACRYALEPEPAVSNLELMHRLCEILDERMPRADGAAHASAIVFDGVARLAPAAGAQAAGDLPAPGGWRPLEPLETSLARLVEWHIAHDSWWMPLRLAAAAAPKRGKADKARNAA